MLIDYHIHTKLCGHASGEMEEYVENAIKNGLAEMGFSDHLPLFHIEPGDLSMKMEDFPIYVNKVKEMQEKYKDKITIRFGCEVEYTPEIEKKTKDILSQYNFDYLLGSTHFLGMWIFDHPDHKDEFEKRDIYEIYSDYFNGLEKMISSGMFDIVAHIDLIKKFGYKPSRPLEEIYKKVAKKINENNMAIEINTSGLHKPVKEMYPTPELLKICFEANIPVTLGSDAHRPEDVTRDFDKAIELIKNTGYTKIAQFVNRKRILINI